MTPNETIGYFVGYMQKHAEKDMDKPGVSTPAAVVEESEQDAPQPAPQGDFWNTPDTMRGN